MFGIVTLFCVGFLLPDPAQSVTDPCYFWPGGGFQNNKCFLAFKEILTLEDSQIVCLVRGGQMAEVRTQAEIEGFNTFLQDKGAVNIWMPVRLLDETQSWPPSYVWLSDQAPVEDDLWDDGEPSDTDTQKCVQYESRNKNPLQTTKCDKEGDQFVCERALQDPCEENYPGSTHILGQCWNYFYTEKTWKEARDHCAKMGGFLAEPRDDYQREVFHQFLLSKTDQFPVTTWLGASYNNSQGTYKWVKDNEVLSSVPEVDLFLQDPNRGEFLAMFLQNNTAEMVWADKPGGISYAYVCQSAPPSDSIYTYLVVIPKMDATSSSEVKVIQVTSGWVNRPVDLTLVQSTSTGTQTFTTALVDSETPVEFVLDVDLELNRTGIFHKYAEVQASGHVTVVFFYKGERGAESTLILPNEILSVSDGGGLVHFVPSSYLSGSQLAIVALQNETTEVTVYFRQHDEIHNVWFHLDAVTYSDIESASTTLNNKYETMYLNTDKSSNKAIVISSRPVAVFLSMPKVEESNSDDFFLEKIQPIELLGSNYITIPTPPIASYEEDVFVAIGVYENTVLKVTEGEATREVTLVSPGDVEELSLSNQEFHLVTGNKPFYLYKYAGFHVNKSTDMSVFYASGPSCETSLFPEYLWRFQYDIQMTLSVPEYDVYIMLILPGPLTQTVLINGVLEVNLACREIHETQFSGCSYRVPESSVASMKIHLVNYQSTFGAYMYGKSSTSSFCHPLGVSVIAEPVNAFDFESYIRTLETLMTAPTPCETTTLQSTSDFTTVASVSTIVTSDETTSVDTTTSYNNDSTSFSITWTPVAKDPSTVKPFVINVTQDEINILTEKIEHHLLVNRKRTSAYERTKSSAPDKRVSAQTIGWMGVLLLTVLFLFVLVSDSITIYDLTRKG